MRLFVGNDLKEAYPKVAERICKKVLASKTIDTFGILTCKTGIGMCIVANKFPGIRAVNATSVKVARKARQRNNCNVICLGRDLFDAKKTEIILTTFLTTKYQKQSDKNLNLINQIERRLK